jgi:hypothetical protein
VSLRDLNRDHATLKASLPLKTSEADLYPDDAFPAGLRRLRRGYAVADALANVFQKRWYRAHARYLCLTLAVGLLLSMNSYCYFLKERSSPLAKESPAGMSAAASSSPDRVPADSWPTRIARTMRRAAAPGEWILTLSYLVAVGGLFYLYEHTQRRGYYRKHQQCRALAEALRVQFFWRLAGLSERVAEQYPRYAAGNLDWVRASAQAACLPPDDVVQRRVRDVTRHWVTSQREYFGAKCKRVTMVFLCLAVAWGAGKVLARYVDYAVHDHSLLRGGVDLVLVLLGTTPFVVAALAGLHHLRGYREHASRYARMAGLYSFAERQLRLMTGSRNGDAAAKAVILELGREALAESAEWLVLHSQRRLEIPR